MLTKTLPFALLFSLVFAAGKFMPAPAGRALRTQNPATLTPQATPSPRLLATSEPRGCLDAPLELTPAAARAEPGEAIYFSAAWAISQGDHELRYAWTASAGAIVGVGPRARFDTTSVKPGTEIEVSVTVSDERRLCLSAGRARVIMIPSPAPTISQPRCRSLGSCSFRRNSARVDNACKDVLHQVTLALQSDPQARLVVDAYQTMAEIGDADRNRAKQVRDRLSDGMLGSSIDANRIVTRRGGSARNEARAYFWHCPAGATPPPGPTPVDVGKVTLEPVPIPSAFRIANCGAPNARTNSWKIVAASVATLQQANREQEKLLDLMRSSVLDGHCHIDIIKKGRLFAVTLNEYASAVNAQKELNIVKRSFRGSAYLVSTCDWCPQAKAIGRVKDRYFDLYYFECQNQ